MAVCQTIVGSRPIGTVIGRVDEDGLAEGRCIRNAATRSGIAIVWNMAKKSIP